MAAVEVLPSSALRPAWPIRAAYGSLRSSTGLTASPAKPAGSVSEGWGQRLWFLGLLGASGFRARDGQRTIARGRNFYKNILGKKGPAERKQAKVTAKHLRTVMIAVREGGGPDSTVNRMLRNAIKGALKDNVPRDTVDRRIKAMSESKEMFNELEVSGYGPGGAAVVIEAVTDNTNRTRSVIKDAFKSVNGEVKNVGDHIFKRVGVLQFEEDEEKVLEASMEADAEVEDVVTTENGTVEALTLPENFHNVVQAFEEAGMEPLKTEVETRVEVEAPLGHEQTYEVLRLLHQLEDIDDVGEVHHNAVFNDEVELKFNAYGIPLAYATAYKK